MGSCVYLRFTEQPMCVCVCVRACVCVSAATGVSSISSLPV